MVVRRKPGTPERAEEDAPRARERPPRVTVLTAFVLHPCCFFFIFLSCCPWKAGGSRSGRTKPAADGGNRAVEKRGPYIMAKSINMKLRE